MSDMSVDTVFQSEDEARRDRQWAIAHPIWARVGRFMERVAAFCGTHSAGYISPVLWERRIR